MNNFAFKGVEEVGETCTYRENENCIKMSAGKSLSKRPFWRSLSIDGRKILKLLSEK
jgi:hypothetical protein